MIAEGISGRTVACRHRICDTAAVGKRVRRYNQLKR